MYYDEQIICSFVIVFPPLDAPGLLKNDSEGCRPELFTKQGHFARHHKMEGNYKIHRICAEKDL